MVQLYIVESYIIALNPESPRNLDLKNSIKSFGAKVNLIEGVDGRKLSSSDIDLLTKSRLIRALIGRQLSGPELGCALSHKKVYELTLSHKDKWRLILEEDAVLACDIETLNQFITCFSKLGNEPRVINLFYSHTTPFKSGSVNLVDIGSSKYIIGEFFFPPTYAVAYFINEAAVRIALQDDVITGPPDWPLWGNKVIFMGVVPNLFMHLNDGKSVLSKSRDEENSKVFRHYFSICNLFSYYWFLTPRKLFIFSSYFGGLVKFLKYLVFPRVKQSLKYFNQKKLTINRTYFYVR